MNFKPVMSSPEELAAKQPRYKLVTDFMVPVNLLITFRAEQPIREVIDTIIDEGISGGPVLDEGKKLIGIISEKDCLRLMVDEAYHNLPSSTRTVSDYMTRQVLTLAPTSDVVEAANAFLNSPVRRLPIVDNGKLVGQVSRRDILKAAQEMARTSW
jgi:CBS domain-containing protein